MQHQERELWEGIYCITTRALEPAHQRDTIVADRASTPAIMQTGIGNADGGGLGNPN